MISKKCMTNPRENVYNIARIQLFYLKFHGQKQFKVLTHDHGADLKMLETILLHSNS